MPRRIQIPTRRMSRNFETVQRRRGNTPRRTQAYPAQRRRAAAFAVRAAMLLHPELDRDGAEALLNNQTENIYWPITMALLNERPRIVAPTPINPIQPNQRAPVIFIPPQPIQPIHQIQPIQPIHQIQPVINDKNAVIRIINRLNAELLSDNIDADRCIQFIRDLIEINPFCALLINENQLVKIKWENFY